MLEAVVEEKVTEDFENHGWLARKTVYAGRRSAPDKQYRKRGYTVDVEFKRFDKHLDGLQVREHRKLGDHGVKVHVIDTIADGLELRRRLDAEITRRGTLAPL